MGDNENKVVSSLLSSGFPFQTAITDLITKQPKWSIERTEYPWEDINGQHQFLDIVAYKGNLIATIECKKTEKEILTFLNPGSHPDNITGSYCINLKQVQDSTQRMDMYNSAWYFLPPSFNTSYCVVSTSDSGKDHRLLERDAALLIRGTDALAVHFKESFNPKTFPNTERIHVPIIVTNAPLYVASYDPIEVSLQSGRFTEVPNNMTEVPWVRFTKSFTSNPRGVLMPRTIFAINALKFAEFLKTIDFERGRPPTNSNIVQS
jgi:hypothetical protein